MAKTSITIGLPDPVLKAVEIAQRELYLKSLDALAQKAAGQHPKAGFSRAQTIEFLICDGLEKHGIDVDWGKLECNSKSDAGDSGDAERGDVADTSGSSS